MKQHKKYSIGIACGAGLLIAGIVWSAASGEGANIGAGVVQLAGIAAILSFGVPLLRSRMSRRKQ